MVQGKGFMVCGGSSRLDHDRFRMTLIWLSSTLFGRPEGCSCLN